MNFDDTRSKILNSYLQGTLVDVDAIARSCESGTVGEALNFDLSGFVDLPSLRTGYEPLNIISGGDSDVIRRARDKRFHRTVALRAVSESAPDPEDARRYMLREALITAQLDHPAIIPIYDMRTDENGGVHVAMKLVDGKPLGDYLEKLRSLYKLLPRPQLAVNEVRSFYRRLDIFLHLSDALSYVHHKQLAHNHLSTKNIVLGHHRNIYVLGWGSAFEIPASKSPSDWSSDVLAAGKILFELIFLRPPEANETSPRHAFNLPVSKDLRAIALKAISTDPKTAYPSIHAMADDVRRFLSDCEVSANPDGFFDRLKRRIYHSRRAMLAISVTLALALLGAASLYLYRNATETEARHREFNIMSRIYGNCMSTGTELDRQFRDAEAALVVIEREAVSRLSEPAAPADRSLLDAGCSVDSIKPPAGYGFVQSYDREISLDCFVYASPPGGLADLQDLIVKLAPLRRRFLSLIWNSTRIRNIPHYAPERMKEEILSGGKPALSYLKLALQNGLYVAYPYFRGLPENFDPRNCPWYKNSLNDYRDDILWQPPSRSRLTGASSVVGTLALRDDANALLGFAAAEMDIDAMFAPLMFRGNTGTEVIAKMLVTAKGTVVADTSQTIEPMGQFPDMDLLSGMQRRGRGWKIMFPQGNKPGVIYCFYRLESPNWLYIEKIDYQAAMSHTEAGEED
ncbi:MAG: protein kinase [Victivallaceae bacterium]|nr:protein kinase [Victivallaceae bacterium]